MGVHTPAHYEIKKPALVDIAVVLGVLNLETIPIQGTHDVASALTDFKVSDPFFPATSTHYRFEAPALGIAVGSQNTQPKITISS